MKKVILAIMAVVLFISFCSCTRNKTDYSGEYYYTVPTARLFTPKLNLLEDGTFVLEAGDIVYFTGTYSVNNNSMTISIVENNADIGTDDLKDLTIMIVNNNTLSIVSKKPLPFDADTITAYSFERLVEH